jgi:hypothetical protein
VPLVASIDTKVSIDTIVQWFVSHDYALKEHHADGTISIQVLKGSIRFTAQGDDHSLRVNGVLMLGPSIKHKVEALEESALLLTIAWPGEKNGDSVNSSPMGLTGELTDSQTFQPLRRIPSGLTVIQEQSPTAGGLESKRGYESHSLVSSLLVL